MARMTAEELLAAFVHQIRRTDADVVPGHLLEQDGPVRRTYPADPRQPGAMIESPDGLGPDPDAAIARQVAFFSGRAQRVEWKIYDHDEPPDLGDRLTRAGFTREADEALVLGDLAVLSASTELPLGVRVRFLGPGSDLSGIEALHDLVFGRGSGWLTAALADEQAADPDLLDICVVEEERTGSILTAGWVRYQPGTDFAGMWGGATHPAHRRRGLYRACLAARALRALDRGYGLARVDASAQSEPILRSLGLVRVGTTTPFVLDPT